MPQGVNRFNFQLINELLSVFKSLHTLGKNFTKLNGQTSSVILQVGILLSKRTCSSSQSFFLLHIFFHLQPDVFGHVYNIKKKNPGRRRRKKGPFWGNMARINLEILFYLIWTKLLAWTRCPQRAGTQPPQPRWARSGPQICHCDHGAHMNPWFFNSSPFMQQIRSTSLLSLDSILYPQTVSQEKPDIFLLLPPLLRLSCLFACVRKNEEEAKETRECVKKKYVIQVCEEWI